MIRFALLLPLIVLMASEPASALPQTGQTVAGTPRAGTLNQPYITGSGHTVPHPSLPQSDGQTQFDRSVEHRDNQIMNSVCPACR